MLVEVKVRDRIAVVNLRDYRPQWPPFVSPFPVVTSREISLVFGRTQECGVRIIQSLS